MSWSCCKHIKNFFKFRCMMRCCETELDCENSLETDNNIINNKNNNNNNNNFKRSVSLPLDQYFA